jgi:tyrosinase
MAQVTRRKFIATTALGTAAAFTPFSTGLLAQEMRARPNVYSARGQAMLALYEKAVGVMKSRHEGDPTSWAFQWYTHWVPGVVSDDKTKNEKIAKLPPEQRPAAQTMWNTCQGHGPDRAATIPYFLPWHRMQLYYFEQIVREACQEPSFVMPYWNYLQKDAGVLPPRFRDKHSPLYNPDRRPPGHPGAGVNEGEVVPNDEVTYDCLKLPDYYLTGSTPPNFSASINNNPHGIMHDLIGNEFTDDMLKAGMSFIPTAANDAIFFLHHCNIDRLWASWNAAGNKNPDQDPKDTDEDWKKNWAKKEFTFAKPDKMLEQRKVGSVSDTKQLGYIYVELEPVPKPVQAVAALRAAPRPAPATLGARSAIALGAAAQDVTLTPPPGKTNLTATRSGGRVYLVIEGLKVDALPGTHYDIYLGAPKGATGAALKPYYVGTPSFFEAVGMPGMGTDLSFDVTDIMAKLGKKQPQVRIVPRGAPRKGANPSIAKISLVEG